MDLFDHQPSAQQLADEGMKRAADHADAVQPEPKWTDQAYAFFLRYAEKNTLFMTEDVRVWSYQNGLPHPPDGRAWGHVTVRAKKERIIQTDHYQKTKYPPAHATPREVFRSLIMGGIDI